MWPDDAVVKGFFSLHLNGPPQGQAFLCEESSSKHDIIFVPFLLSIKRPVIDKMVDNAHRCYLICVVDVINAMAL